MTLIRPALEGDLDAHSDLEDAAFGGPAEGRLVAALARDGHMVLHLVSEEDGAIVGHIAFSRPTADDGRYGFDAGAVGHFATAYDGPHLQALAFTPLGHASRGRFTYPTAFADLAWLALPRHCR